MWQPGKRTTEGRKKCKKGTCQKEQIQRLIWRSASNASLHIGRVIKPIQDLKASLLFSVTSACFPNSFFFQSHYFIEYYSTGAKALLRALYISAGGVKNFPAYRANPILCACTYTCIRRLVLNLEYLKLKL